MPNCNTERVFINILLPPDLHHISDVAKSRPWGLDKTRQAGSQISFRVANNVQWSNVNTREKMDERNVQTAQPHIVSVGGTTDFV